MVRTRAARTLAVLALVAVTAACTPRDVAVGLCRDPERPVIEVPGDHEVPWPPTGLHIANGSTVEAGGQVWVHDEPSTSGHRIGVKVHRPDVANSVRMDLCFIGGDLYTTMHPETTPWSEWHDTYAFVQENRDATVVGVRLFNTGDGIAFTHRAHNWRVVGVRADGGGAFAGAYVHDDCIENDGMFEGLVVDSKFDGCHTFLSSNAGEVFDVPPDGTGRTVRIERTLVRLQGYEQSFDVPKYGTGRHGGFFKFSNNPATGIPPQLVIRDSTFRSDDRAPYGGNANGPLGLPPGSVCERVMLIGTESWPERDLQSWVDQCTDLRFGNASDWWNQIVAWDEDHPVL
jgi:hypothetical protein